MSQQSKVQLWPILALVLGHKDLVCQKQYRAEIRPVFKYLVYINIFTYKLFNILHSVWYLTIHYVTLTTACSHWAVYDEAIDTYRTHIRICAHTRAPPQSHSVICSAVTKQLQS